MHSVLQDCSLPIFTSDGEPRNVDLAQLFELYERDDVAAHIFLRPHHGHPWHAFCVQLGALALHRAGETGVAHDAETWRTLLRGLTAEWSDDEPWRLVVENLSAPAFLQPPVPEGSLEGFRNEVASVDDLDVLVTSKNHGVKQGQGAGSSPAEWVAALVSLQTTGGFLGAGNYGVARMNGGFATRPGIGLVPEGGPGARWQRDVGLLLRHRDWAIERVPGIGTRGEHALLWCLPWGGTRSLGVDELDPWFIEVCRRVRLVPGTSGDLVAWTRPTKVARIAAAAFKGSVGDPWTPIKQDKEPAAYNSTPTYAVMSEVLFDGGKWDQPLLLRWHDEDRAPMSARFEVFVRGQGQTRGYYQRSVHIDETKKRYFFAPDQRERVARLAREMVEDVRKVLGGKVLRTALLALVQSGPEQVKFGDRTAGRWADRFCEMADREVDRRFFEFLFERAEDEDAGRRRWLEFLRDLAIETFEHAVAAAPVAGARRPRAIAVAERIFRGALYRTFPELGPTRKETSDAA